MCGITGAIELGNKSSLDFSKGSDLHQYIGNRGPDFYSSLVVEKNDWKVTLAHSRLAIIDLTALSNQPMISKNGRYILTFNGEIYNYKEIRDELISIGLSFYTEGDTEVLLQAWETWGQKCLTKLNGMFVFGIFDKEKQELFLVRDRFGVKPLVYNFDPRGRLVFSSSIKAVAKHSDGEVDLEYCSNGLKFGYFEGNKDSTPFEKVKYVESGSILKFQLGSKISLQKEIWYDLEAEVYKKVADLSALNHDELIEYGRSIFEEAVKLRLRSDVPLAVSLSGGVDSSSIASIASQGNENLTAFTYGSPKDSKSEGPIIDKFVKEKKLQIHYIYPEYSIKELGDLYDNTLSAQEAPFLGLSIMAQHEVYKKVKQEGYKVLLGGQGGDEIFAGYRKFFLVALKDSWKRSQFSESLGYFLSLGQMLFHEVDQLNIYWKERKRYLKKTGKDLSILTSLPSVSNDILGSSPLQQRQIADIQRYSIPVLLRYEDRNSMYHSIESRLPFMDYRVVEFALALPDAMKIKNGFGKWALRLMMEKDVPKYILRNRLKRGFDVTQDWINMGVGKRLRSNILDKKSKVVDFVDDYDKFEKSLTLGNLSDSNFLNEAIVLNFLIDPL